MDSLSNTTKSNEIKSRIFPGWVLHTRMNPVSHTFRYRVFYYAFDLDDLTSGRLQKELYPWFSYYPSSSDKKGLMPSPVSIGDDDYLGLIPGRSTIREKLNFHLDARGIPSEEITRVELITVAKFFGYVFNPVSFYYCYSKGNMGEERVRCIVTEINNTFGETHLYLLDNKNNDTCHSAHSQNNENEKYRYHDSKTREFHVSPFNNLGGEYQFSFSDIENSLYIKINITNNHSTHNDNRDDQSSNSSKRRMLHKPFYAILWSDGALPLTAGNLFRTVFVDFPFSNLLTSPRIIYHAALLHFRKGLPVYVKPNPVNEDTITLLPPTPIESQSIQSTLQHMSTIESLLLSHVSPSSLSFQKISLNLPSGNTVHWFESQQRSNSGDTDVSVHVKNYNFFVRLVSHNFCMKSLAQSFAADEFTCENMIDFIGVFRGISRISHVTEKKMIEKCHGDEDPTLSHVHLDDITKSDTCGIFQEKLTTSGDTTKLTHSHCNNVRNIVEKLQINENDHVLEVGAGWGGFALELVRIMNCKVTAVTSSRVKYQFIQEEIKKKLSDSSQQRISVLYCPDLESISTISQRYSKIISVEGLDEFQVKTERDFSDFFSLCEKMLVRSYAGCGTEKNKVVFVQSVVPAISNSQVDVAVNALGKEMNEHYRLVESKKSLRTKLSEGASQWMASAWAHLEAKYFASITNYVVSPYTFEQRFDKVMSQLPKKFSSLLESDSSFDWLPLSSILSAIDSTGSLCKDGIESLPSVHYQKTFSEWQSNLQRKMDEKNRGSYDPLREETERVWSFYLSLGESMFTNGNPQLEVVQITLSQSNNMEHSGS